MGRPSFPGDAVEHGGEAVDVEGVRERPFRGRSPRAMRMRVVVMVAVHGEDVGDTRRRSVQCRLQTFDEGALAGAGGAGDGDHVAAFGLFDKPTEQHPDQGIG